MIFYGLLPFIVFSYSFGKFSQSTINCVSINFSQVILQDVIEIDKDDSAAAMFIDEKVDGSIKGKAVKNSSDGYHVHQSKVYD